MNRLSFNEKLSVLYSYSFRTMPEVNRLLNRYAAQMPSSLAYDGAKRRKVPLCNMYDLKCVSVLLSFGGKRLDDCLEFLIPLHILCHALDRILESRQPTEMSEVGNHYRPLLAAVNPQLPLSADYECLRDKETTDALMKLCSICRDKLCSLPEYKAAAGKMKKYARLYVELQFLKYQPYKTRSHQLVQWSDYYIRQFSDISYWEFAAAADSLLGISAAYISAHEGIMSEEYAGMLDSAYLPWICSYQKMLQYFLSARDDQMTGHLNMSHFYNNLKHCEERLSILSNKAMACCAELPDGKRHAALVQAMPVIYLSDPQAEFGLARLATHNLMKSGSSFARTLWNMNRLANIFK